jgi:lipoprotein-releasing system permease protein
MKAGVNIEIAITHLLAKKRQTLVAMMGVTFGIGMYLLMISFMTGFNEYLEDALLSSTPDIRIYNDIKTDYSKSILHDISDSTKTLVHVQHPKPKDVNPNIRNSGQILSDLKKANIIAASPQVSTQVFYNSGPVQINGTLNGVKILEEAKLTGLADKMKIGSIEDLLKTDNGIILGHGLAKKLNVSMGDLVTLATPKGTSMRFRVVGTFQFGFGSIDNIRSYVNIAKVQQILGKDNQYITDISVKLRDINQAKIVAADFSKRYGYKADDWETANASAMVSIKIRNVMTVVVSFTLLVVAGFGIYNIMNMTIQNKLKDIAILKAQGFAANDILQIFLFQSMVIGFFGAILGLILGFLMSYGVWSLPFPSNEMIAITNYPVTFHLRHYVFGIVFGMLTTFFAGLLPSLKAGKIDPVAILRG